MSAQTYCPNCDIVYSMAHECCPLCMLKQVSGELCDKCGWAMRFPQEPCRCELEEENSKLKQHIKTYEDLLDMARSYLSLDRNEKMVYAIDETIKKVNGWD